MTHLTIIINNYYWYPWMYAVIKKNCQNITHFSIDTRIVGRYKMGEVNILEIIMSMAKLKYFRLEMDISGESILRYRILEQLPEGMKEIHFIAVCKWMVYEGTPVSIVLYIIILKKLEKNIL